MSHIFNVSFINCKKKAIKCRQDCQHYPHPLLAITVPRIFLSSPCHSVTKVNATYTAPDIVVHVIACDEACGLLSVTLRLSAPAQQSADPQSVGAGAVVCCENPLRQQPPSSVTFLSLSFTFCHIL